MIRKHWHTFSLIAVVLVMVFVNVDSRETIQAYKLEKERDKKALERKDSNIRDLLDSLHKQDLVWLKHFQEATIRADRAEAENKKIKARYDKIRFVRHDSDRERDSVIFAILHD